MAATKHSFDPNKVNVKKHLILPVLKYEVEEPIFITITSPLQKSNRNPEKFEKAGAAKGEKMKPATVCQVFDLTTGEARTLVANTVLVSTLQEAYPGDKYVGLSFRIVKHAKEKGKRYHTFSVDEIDA